METKLLVVSYPFGAGGKFLLNCIGMSKGCVLQDKALLDCNYQSAWEEIQSRFPTPGSKWNDLNLGCLQLFGFYPSEEQDTFPFYCKEVFERGVYMPTTAHSFKEIQSLSQHRNINLVNCSVLQKYRNWFTVENDLPTIDLEWDCNWFFDEQKTLNEISNLYENLQLTDFQKVIQYIKLYRLRWLEAIHG